MKLMIKESSHLSAFGIGLSDVRYQRQSDTQLVTPFEATELEKDLFVWFRRFCYRPGASVRENRPYLLVACCQFAREYQKYLVGSGVRSSDDRLKGILEREPADVAHDFSRSLQLYDFRRSDA